MTAPNVCKDEASGRKKKKQDRSKFHTPKYIKVTPVSIASKQRNRNCSFLQLGVGLWRGFLVGGETGWEGEHRKLCWVTYRENDDNEKHLVKNPLVWKYDSGVKMRSWHRVKGDKKKVGFHRSSFFMLKSCIRVDFIWHCKSAGDSAACMVQHCGNTCDFVLDLFRKFCFISCVFFPFSFFWDVANTGKNINLTQIWKCGLQFTTDFFIVLFEGAVFVEQKTSADKKKRDQS